MPRFFIDGAASGPKLYITGDDARHIGLSLRMKSGDPLTVCDGTGREFSCRIDSITPDSVALDVVSVSESRTEPPVKITLCQCFLKGDKADELIRGCVELGVSEVRFVHSCNAVSRPDPDSALKKTARWQKIAAEASKQCGRGAIPRVLPPLTFSEAAEKLK
ncbi:MAG: 16S rRNA (uracil(1498)-N(3))-methyltransferase, partial [Clostridia bacterium]|nr:16S rRNA (uracil(1498)-N(3))-methyltransferase [Clostridia bacterium]